MEITPARIPVDGFTLEGAVHAPAEGEAVPVVVLCHPHPQYGGDMDNNVVVAARRGLVEAGFGAVAFNFRGVGASGGAYGGGIGEREDVTAAVRFAATREQFDPARIGLMGYSFGAGVAAAAAAGGLEVRALALVSPAIRDDTLLGHLAALAIPVLVLVGSEDAASPDERVAELAALDHVEARVVPGVDHFWWGQEGTIAEAVRTFFARHLVR